MPLSEGSPFNPFLFYEIGLAIAELMHFDSTFAILTIEIESHPIFDSGERRFSSPLSEPIPPCH
jgi:hypothetical protein